MKKLFIVMVLLITSLLTLTVCNRLEENNDTLLALIGLASGGSQFTKTVALTTTTGALVGPFNEGEFRHYQMLYEPDYIAGSGNIRSLFFRFEGANHQAVTSPHVTIRLGHTSVDDLGTDMAANINQGKGSAVTVLDDRTVRVPEGADGEYFEIPLSGSFNYNGVDNLVVDIVRTSACSADVELKTGGDGDAFQELAYAVDGATPDTALVTADDFHHMKVSFVGGDNKVDFADTYSGNSAPLSTTANFNKIQMLYNASSIAGSGMITGIGLQVSAVTSLQTYTYTMKLAHSTKIDLEVTWANNFNAGPAVTMANSVQITVPAGVPAGEFIWFPVPDGVFSYNGTDNLLIELTVEAASGGVSLATHPTTNINRIYGNPANAAASTPNSYTHQINLRFVGSTVNKIIGTGGYDSNRWFGTTVAGVVDQYLYLASELGTGGAITRIACRIDDSFAGSTSKTTYTNFDMVMSNTTAAVLGTDYAANLPAPVTVHSGTFTLPAGLTAGDWVEVRLKRPFRYNPTMNLVVQVRSDAGANNCPLSVRLDSARYTDRRMTGPDRSSITGTPSDVLKDVLLWISN